MTSSIALAAAFSFLLLAVLHWATLTLRHGELGVLWRYGLGVGAIGAIFGAWCWRQPQSTPTMWAYLAWVAIAVSAGAGTVTGHAIDRLAAMQRRVRYLERNGEQANIR
jgi:hypothetical protein